MKKIVLVLCLVLLAASLFAGAQQEQEAEEQEMSEKQEKITIGFSNGFSGNVWRAMMLHSVKNEAAKYPNVEFIVVDGQGDISKQVNDIQSLIAMDVDGIMLIPNSPQAVEPVLIEARERGIKVCNFNLPLENEDAYDIYVGTDMVNKGYRVVSWLVEELDGRGKVVALGGIPGNSGTAQWMKGAEKALDGTDIEILAYRDAYWQEDKAKIIMADLINAYGQIDGILADGGGPAAGALKALLDAGRPLVPSTGDDYNGLYKLYMKYKDEYPAFDIGTISEPTWQSREAFKALVKLLQGEPMDEWVVVKPDLITGEDVGDYVKPDFPDALFLDNDLSDATLRELTE
jgi:ribose transport system substrate-binding protein